MQRRTRGQHGGMSSGLRLVQPQLRLVRSGARSAVDEPLWWTVMLTRVLVQLRTTMQLMQCVSSKPWLLTPLFCHCCCCCSECGTASAGSVEPAGRVQSSIQTESAESTAAGWLQSAPMHHRSLQSSLVPPPPLSSGLVRPGCASAESGACPALPALAMHNTPSISRRANRNNHRTTSMRSSETRSNGLDRSTRPEKRQAANTNSTDRQ